MILSRNVRNRSVERFESLFDGDFPAGDLFQYLVVVFKSRPAFHRHWILPMRQGKPQIPGSRVKTDLRATGLNQG